MKKTFQDILSSVKTALTSDTGKAIGMGLGAAALGGAIGGEGGVRLAGALGQAVTNARNKKKQDELEVEDRDLRKLKMTKAELDLDASRENITSKRFDNMKKIFGDNVSNAFMPFGGKFGKSTTAVTDKYGKIGEHDVALEGKVTSVENPSFTPTPVARTGPESAMVSDEKQLIKNVEKIKSSAAADAAKLAIKNGYAGRGREFLLQNRTSLANDVKSFNFEPEYEKAFWRELQEQIAPGSIARAKEMLATEPEYTTKEAFAENWPSAVGSVAGGFIGAMPGIATLNLPLAIAGGSAGFTAGNYAGRTYDEWLSSQKDVTPTPAVAGADKTAADMAAYSMSLEGTKLLIALKNSAEPQNIPSLVEQLPQLSDFKALPVGDQERIISELQNITPGFGSRARLIPPKIGPYYRPQGNPHVDSFRNTINDMGSWATRKLGIGD